MHRSDPGAGQGGIPRGEPLGGCAVFLGPRAGKPASSSCPHPQPLRLHSWDRGGLGMHAGRRAQGGRMCWRLMRAGTSAQPFGPRPAGAPGRKAEHAGRCGHRLLLGGLRCRGLVLPEPGMGLCSQFPVREAAVCVPRGRVGVTAGRRREGLGPSGEIWGGSRGDDVISGRPSALSALPSLSAPSPTFNLFSWHTCLLGVASCLLMMFLISPGAAGGSLLLMGLLSALLTARGGPSSWGYVSQALLFHQVQGAGGGSMGRVGEERRRAGSTPAPGRPRVDSRPG